MTGNNSAAETQAQNYYTRVEQELTDTVLDGRSSGRLGRESQSVLSRKNELGSVGSVNKESADDTWSEWGCGRSRDEMQRGIPNRDGVSLVLQNRRVEQSYDRRKGCSQTFTDC